MSNKIRTTIHIDESLIDSLRSSGVRNISAHIESLIRNELNSKFEQDEVFALENQQYGEVIDALEEEWLEIKS